MPIIRPWQDPITRDYVIERGAPRHDSTHVSDVARRLATQRGTVPTLPHFGSRLHRISKMVKNVGRLAVNYAREALADLVHSRAIRDLEISATTSRTRIDLLVSFRDRTGLQQTVNYSSQVL